jgi:hypothetical protein
LGLGWGFGSGQPQLTNQSVLKGSPQPLDSTLGLRRACQDQGPRVVLTSAYLASAYLGGRPFVD